MSAPLAHVEIPKALRKRPRDRRGYPIPWIVLIDTNKRPHFTINDGARTLACGRKKLCGLCGGKLRKDIAFVGGTRCFLSPMGAFSDPPMHRDCAAYALAVCPYLAAPSYAKRIDDRTLTPGATPGGVLIRNDDSVREDRPAAFMLGSAAAFTMIIRDDGAPLFRALDEWLDISVWVNGQIVTGAAMEDALARDAARWR